MPVLFQCIGEGGGVIVPKQKTKTNKQNEREQAYMYKPGSQCKE